MKVGDENPEILFTIKDITTNETVGKLVDALVIKEVFQSVSDGKSKIALAITDKGWIPVQQIPFYRWQQISV